MQPKYLKDKDLWILAEDIPDIDFQFSQIWLSSFVNDLKRACGKNYKKVLSIYRGFSLKFYYGEKDSDDFARYLLAKLVARPAFGKKINAKIRVYSDKLKTVSGKITPEFLSGLSREALADFYKQLDELHTELYIWGWLPNAVDMFHANFTEHLKSLLREKLPEKEVNTALVALSTFPEKSILNLEHESFLKLTALQQKRAEKQVLDDAIQKHLNRFFYLKHLWLGKEGVYTHDYYVREIKHFIRSKEDAQALLNKEKKAFTRTLRERAELLKALKFSKKEAGLFNTYAEFAVTKAYRRDAQLFWAYKMDFVFAELTQRLKLTLSSVRTMFPWEVDAALRKGLNSAVKKELGKRFKFSVFYGEAGVNKMFYGKEAKQFEKSVSQEISREISELSGQTACLGKARGKVRIVNSVADMKKMKKGDILVSIATNPDIVAAMKKAAAIVTEQGGVTSHAAIVSRELNIPCVIGTKIATKVFRDGDRVEVDAVKGIVRKLNNS